MVVSGATIDTLLKEKEMHASPESCRKRALVKDESIYLEAANDFEAFWAEEAERLHRYTRWSQVLDWSPPFAAGSPQGARPGLARRSSDRIAE